MKWMLILPALLLSACQGMHIAKQEIAEPAPERNEHMAGVVIWWAHGTEPFWHFTAKADAVSFENMGDSPEEFPYRVFGADGPDRATRTFHARNASSAIQITMKRKTCINQMSGAAYPWTAEIVIAGKNLQGCGERGRLPE